METAKRMTQTDALVAQAAAIARFQDTGEAVHAEEAARLSKISRMEIGPHGELISILDATYIANICTENTGGGCMVDFITLTDGRVVTLNDEAVCVFASKDAFYDQENAQPLHEMWITESIPRDPAPVEKPQG